MPVRGQSLGSKSGHSSQHTASLHSLQRCGRPGLGQLRQAVPHRSQPISLPHFFAGGTSPLRLGTRQDLLAFTSRVTVEAETPRRLAIAEALSPASMPSSIAHLSS